jgi:DNA-binding HxlR family transcriptional regulator
VAPYYSLTEKGESLAPVFDAIESWAEEWLDDDETAPEAVDSLTT